MSHETEQLIQQSPLPFTFSHLSLEGVPPEIKLYILLSLHDLPSLRCLKFASREYYLISREYPRCLRTKFKHTYTPSSWSIRFDEALLQTGKEWYTLCNPLRLPHFIWTMPGPLNLQLIRQDYMTGRIYCLTGEWVKDVLRGSRPLGIGIGPDTFYYLHYLNCRFAHCCRIEAESHSPGDRGWERKVSMLCNGSIVPQLDELRRRGNVAKGRRSRYADIKLESDKAEFGAGSMEWERLGDGQGREDVRGQERMGLSAEAARSDAGEAKGFHRSATDEVRSWLERVDFRQQWWTCLLKQG